MRTACAFVVLLIGCGGSGGSGPPDAHALADTASGPDAAPMCGADEGTVFAVRQLTWGEGNSGQWKAYGFDLDGKTSTAASTDLCQPNSGGNAGAAYPDGNAGIDNSFGKNILPTILGLYPTFTADINNSLVNGDFTTLLELLCLPTTGDVPVLHAKLWEATPLGKMPAWDGTDTWMVDPLLLSDPTDPASSTALFPSGSLAGATFDAGTGGTFIISIPVHNGTQTAWMRLTLHAARITMTLSADRKSATGGMIGGVLDTEEFVAEVKKVGFLLGLCGSPLFDSVLTQIRQASDIMNDGTQDVSKTCNGISIGLGFEMGAAQRGGVGPMRTASMACP
jgi:hypothetical protein